MARLLLFYLPNSVNYCLYAAPAAAHFPPSAGAHRKHQLCLTGVGNIEPSPSFCDSLPSPCILEGRLELEGQSLPLGLLQLEVPAEGVVADVLRELHEGLVRGALLPDQSGEEPVLLSAQQELGLHSPPALSFL